MFHCQRFFVATSILFALGMTGCAALTEPESGFAKPANFAEKNAKPSFMERMPWAKKKPEGPEAYPNPVKLAATWTPDTLTQTGRVPTRGFGARVFFYDEKSRPVPVDGTLIVHGFNEEASGNKPEVKRYEFTPEQFTRHFSQSDMGASYSVWIPWDAVGSRQQRVSLVASFMTAEGKTLQGTPSVVLLPGAKDSSEVALAQRFSPDYRKWKLAAAGETTQTSGLTTTTIPRPASRVRSMLSTPEGYGVPTYSTSATWSVAQNSSGNSQDIAMRRPAVETKTNLPTGNSSVPVLPASSRTPSTNGR